METFKKYWGKILFSIVAICSILLLYVWFTSKNKTSELTLKDTIKSKPDKILPKKHDVSGRRVLFIGDSHTAYVNGWQHQLCVKTNMTYKNTAVGGKRTDWMLKELLKNIDSSYNYCFIWGGANDAASYYPIDSTISNIQRMVDICYTYKVLPVVLTGFNPELCLNTKGRPLYTNYIPKYNQLQAQIISRVHPCIVIKNHFVSREDGDCGDFICHMSASGHRKMAYGIINEFNFKTHK